MPYDARYGGSNARSYRLRVQATHSIYLALETILERLGVHVYFFPRWDICAWLLKHALACSVLRFRRC